MTMSADLETSTGEVMAPLSNDVDELLAELDAIREPLAEHQAEAERLTARRLAITMHLRKLGSHDKVTAQHTGQNVGTVTQAIRKETLRRRGKPLTRKKK